MRNSNDALPFKAPLVTTRKSPALTKFAPVGSAPAKPSKSSQYETPPAQFPAKPELLELDEELLELELELEDELLELELDELLELELDEDDDEELLEEDELLEPDEPPPQADSSRARHIKSKGCFMMATDFPIMRCPRGP